MTAIRNGMTTPMLQPNQAGLSYSSPDGNRYFAIERDSTSFGRA